MSLYFLVTAGPKQGETFKIRPDMVVGRSHGDIPLNDPKASGSHAKIELQKDGSLALVDLKSKNGCKVNGHRLSRIPLKAGITIQIGDTSLEVFSKAKTQAKKRPEPVAEEKRADSPPKPQAAAEVDRVQAESAKPRRTWSQILERYSREALTGIEDHPRPVEAFAQAVCLRFVRGVQTDTKWILGYGPRRIGSASIDLPIYEEGAPDVCFELHPNPDGLTFRTQHPEDVHLNGQEINVQSLAAGDVIQISETEIEVEFLP